MSYYARRYGYFEVEEEDNIVARFDDTIKGIRLTGDMVIDLCNVAPDNTFIEFTYYDQKYWEDELMEILNALVPLVIEGSMMEFRGEDNHLWAFVLEDGKWVEHEGFIIYK